MKKHYLVFPLLLLLILSAFTLTTPVQALIWQDPHEDDEKAWLGVMLGSDDADKSGVSIFHVTPGSAADEAGILQLDRIISFNGTPVATAEELSKLIGNHAPGEVVTIGLVRNGQEQTLKVKLGKKSKNSLFAAERFPKVIKHKQRIVEPDVPRSGHHPFIGSHYYLGIDYQELNSDLGAYFGAEDGKGILVLEVAAESPAAAAGLKAGDVIIEINGRSVIDAGDLMNALRLREEETERETLELRILREKRLMDLAVEAKTRGGHHFFSKPVPARWKFKEGGPLTLMFRNNGDVDVIELEKFMDKKGIVQLKGLKDLKKLEHLDLPVLGKLFIEKGKSGSIVINGDEGSFNLSFDEDGTVTLNGRTFETLKQFREFVESEEFKSMIKEMESTLKKTIVRTVVASSEAV